MSTTAIREHLTRSPVRWGRHCPRQDRQAHRLAAQVGRHAHVSLPDQLTTPDEHRVDIFLHLLLQISQLIRAVPRLCLLSGKLDANSVCH